MANLIIQKEQRTTRYYSETLENGIALDMVLIPGGSFIMGSPKDEVYHQETESPQREVSVLPFFMGRYPITQDQWATVSTLPPIDRYLEPDPSNFKGETRPVETVSWHDATEFCRRLVQKTGRPYRLPTEAEWEYACRAGTTTPFHFGKTITTELANYEMDDDSLKLLQHLERLKRSGFYSQAIKGRYPKETTPVDHFDIANTFGLCDMHGNVWEWCQDHWHSSYEGAPVDGSAWLDLSAEEDARRVLRGGSWNVDSRLCRSALRNLEDARARFDFYGFRVMCSAPKTL